MKKNPAAGIGSLPPFDKKSGDLNAVIETPKGSGNKYTFDEETEIFKLGGVMPLGSTFPFDFGFIPNTLGGDGDPLDVLILMDEPAFTGCLIPSRLIGIIEAEQTEDGKTMRNDRLIAVACKSITHDHIKSLDDLNENVVEQIKHFFISYNDAKGKKFVSLGEFDGDKAKQAVLKGAKAFETKNARQTETAAKKKKPAK